MCDEGRWRLRYVSLAAVPRVAVYLVEAAVSGEGMVNAWIAAMETALLCTSVNRGIAPVITSVTQAAVVAGLAVDAAGLTPGGGGVPVLSSDWFIKVV